MHEANRDVFPSEDTRNAFPGLHGLFDQPIIDDAFRKRDKAAVSAKRAYHRYGRLAITLIAASAIYSVAQALDIIADGIPDEMSLVAVVMAGIGILLQVYLIGTGKKEQWLLERFAVERLRSLKFQSFRAAQAATSPEDLKERAAAFALREVGRLNDEIGMGAAMISNFNPARAVTTVETPESSGDPALLMAASVAYDELRLTYQKRFAQSELNRMAGRRRIFESSQDMIYMGAAVFAFLSLFTKGLQALGHGVFTEPVVAWIDFLAVAFFISGASKAIMDNAGIEEQSRTRYERYIRDIETIGRQSEAGAVSFAGKVAAMEHVSLGELDVFCRAAERISYRL